MGILLGPSKGDLGNPGGLTNPPMHIPFYLGPPKGLMVIERGPGYPLREVANPTDMHWLPKAR